MNTNIKANNDSNYQKTINLQRVTISIRKRELRWKRNEVTIKSWFNNRWTVNVSKPVRKNSIIRSKICPKEKEVK